MIVAVSLRGLSQLCGSILGFAFAGVWGGRADRDGD
jgi:hypothetical protein